MVWSDLLFHLFLVENQLLLRSIGFAELAQDLGQFEAALGLRRCRVRSPFATALGASIILKLLQGVTEVEARAVAVGIELCGFFEMLARGRQVCR